jgi:hypothetical protein
VNNIEALHLSDINANALSLADVIDATSSKVLVINGGTTDSVDIDLNTATGWSTHGAADWRGQTTTFMAMPLTSMHFCMFKQESLSSKPWVMARCGFNGHTLPE